MKGVIDRSSLCDRCKAGQVVQASGGRRLVFCRQMGRPVFPDVQACTSYMPMGSGGFWMNGWGGEAHVAEAKIIDPRPQPGQHV